MVCTLTHSESSDSSTIAAGKCLTAASNNDGAWVTIQPCTGSVSQKWTFTGGVVQVFGNKCLDVTDGVNADGSKIQISTCLSQNPSQQWYYDKVNPSVLLLRRGTNLLSYYVVGQPPRLGQ